MLICLDCYLEQEPEGKDDPFSPWHRAPKVYDQCAACQQSTLCAELD